MARTRPEDDSQRQTEALRAEVARLKARERDRKARERRREDELFAQALQSERGRSERHNHYFGLLCLRDFDAQPAKLVREARRVFRCSDTVAAPSAECLGRFGTPEGAARRALLVILPETDRRGVRAALRRAQKALKFAPRHFGYAVYPDDGHTADDLMRRALGGKR